MDTHGPQDYPSTLSNRKFGHEKIKPAIWIFALRNLKITIVHRSVSRALDTL